MAVEAQHNLLHAAAAGGNGLMAAQAAAGWAWAGDAACLFETPPQQQAWYGSGREAARPGLAHGQQGSSSGMGLIAPVPGKYSCGPVCAAVPDASESGITFGGGAQEAALAPRKRKRAEQQGQPPVLGLGGAADVAAHFQHQLADVDRLVLQHTAKLWAELTERRRRQAGLLVAAVEAAAAKRLRAKDEEIGRIGRVNWALEGRVRGLYVEAQVWRDLAQSNEAAANALRGELQLALDAQLQACLGPSPAAGAGADDAESCCCGENDVAGEDEEDEAGTSAAAVATGTTTTTRRIMMRTCMACGVGAAEVLLLPCRHLCACASCAAAARACPACGCAKNGSVSVNFT